MGRKNIGHAFRLTITNMTTVQNGSNQKYTRTSYNAWFKMPIHQYVTVACLLLQSQTNIIPIQDNV